jgi:hypothetical protein
VPKAGDLDFADNRRKDGRGHTGSTQRFSMTAFASLLRNIHCGFDEGSAIHPKPILGTGTKRRILAVTPGFRFVEEAAKAFKVIFGHRLQGQLTEIAKSAAHL